VLAFVALAWASLQAQSWVAARQTNLECRARVSELQPAE